MNTHIGCLTTVIFKIFAVIPLITCLGSVIYYLPDGQFEKILRLDLAILFIVGSALCSYKTCLTFENKNFVITSRIFWITWKKNLNYAIKLHVKTVSSTATYASSGARPAPCSYSVFLQGKFDYIGENISRFFDTAYFINNKEDGRAFLVKVNELEKITGLPVSYSKEAKCLLGELI